MLSAHGCSTTGDGSPGGDVTVKRLICVVSSVPWSIFTVMVSVKDSHPGGRSRSSRRPTAGEYEPLPPVLALTKVTPAGSVSWAVTPVASAESDVAHRHGVRQRLADDRRLGVDSLGLGQLGDARHRRGGARRFLVGAGAGIVHDERRGIGGLDDLEGVHERRACGLRLDGRRHRERRRRPNRRSSRWSRPGRGVEGAEPVGVRADDVDACRQRVVGHDAVASPVPVLARVMV